MLLKRLLLPLLVLCMIVPVSALETPVLAGPEAALYCVETGQMLIDKNADVPVPPASVTKLMTALLVLENCPDLSQETTVSDVAVNSIQYNSTHIALTGGEVVTLEQMMYALLMQSANDAANVLAEHVGGSLESFAEMMNERASELGCQHSHFVNPNGLDDEMHYTSAHDLALITAQLLTHPEFIKISETAAYEIPPTNKQVETRYFRTKQQLLKPDCQYYYEWAVAGKNGWTSKARYTLVTVAKKEGVTLIAVTLGSPETNQKEADTIAMFNYGYNNFALHALTAASLGLEENAFGGRQVSVLLPGTVSESEISCQKQGERYCLSAEWDGVTHVLAEQDAFESVPVIGDEIPPAGEPMAEPVKVFVTVGVGVLGLVLIASGYFAYRLRRIRKQRRYLRQLKYRR